MTITVEATVSRLATLDEAAGPRLGCILMEVYSCDVVGLAPLVEHASLDTTRLGSQPTLEQPGNRVEQLHQNVYSGEANPWRSVLRA